MKGKTVVTNLRINEQDWLQVKVAAAELGMSVNQYVNYLIRDLTQKRQFVGFGKEKEGLKSLVKLAKIQNKPIGEFSKEDKIIYG